MLFLCIHMFRSEGMWSLEVFTVPHVFHVESDWTLLGPQTDLGLILSEITAKQVQVQSYNSPRTVWADSVDSDWTQKNSVDCPRSPLGLCSDCPKTSYDLFNIIEKWPQPELNPWLNVEIFQ